MSVLVLDAGNSLIKAKIARREHGEIAFPHALKQLTETEYNNILSRSKVTGISMNYMRITGKPSQATMIPKRITVKNSSPIALRKPFILFIFHSIKV